MGKRQHVTPKGDVWQLIGENNSRATKLFDSQKEAIKFGKSIAKNQKTELVIHGKDGRIIDSESYGNDPCPPKDKKIKKLMN